MSEGERPAYTFRDSASASERLALVARTFEPSTRALLDRGCGEQDHHQPILSVRDSVGGMRTQAKLGVAPAAHPILRGICGRPDWQPRRRMRAQTEDKLRRLTHW